MHHPAGAQALLIALQTPAPKNYMGIPVLLWGPPGVGKSSYIEALAKPHFPALTLIASIHDPTDFSGLPIYQEGKVHYAVPEWVATFEQHRQGILFLDELTTAPPAVQSALLRIVLERKVGFYQLPPNVRIIAAANPPDLMTGGWDLSPPLRNRFIHLQWDLPLNTYLHALENGFDTAQLPEIDPQTHANLLPYWKLRVIAFLKTAPNLLRSNPETDQHAFTSPRTWDFAIALMTACHVLGLAPVAGAEGKPVFYELMTACLGNAVATPLVAYLNKLRLPDPDDILNGKTKVNIKKLNDSELYVLFGSLNTAITHRFNQPTALLHAAEVYFTLLNKVCQNQRLDTIYVALRKVLKEGLLIKTLQVARQVSPQTLQTIQATIKTVFSDTDLNEFVSILEPK